MFMFAAIAALVAVGSPGAADTVTVGPASMTMADLAARLSVDGRRVRCAAELKNHAALVSLRGRSWSDVRRLLKAGLDVSFVLLPDGSFEMRRDASVLERERKWRSTLAAQLAGIMKAEQDRATPYLGMDPQTVRAEYDRKAAEWQDLRVKEGTNDSPSQRAVRQEMGSLEIARQALGSSTYRLWMEGHRTGPADFLRLLEQGQLWELFAYPGDPGAGAHWVVAGMRLQMYVEGGALSIYPEMFRETSHRDDERIGTFGGIQVRGKLMDALFRGAVRPDGGGLRGLGKEAETWLDSRLAVTKAFLSTSRATESFRLTGRADSLSQGVESWAQDRNEEVVMELWPQVEGLRSAPLTNATLPFATLFGDIASPCWSLDEQDGVLTVRNDLAFFIRPVPFPIAALLRLTDRLSSLLLTSARHLSTYMLETAPEDELWQYVQESGTSSAPWILADGFDRYRGIRGRDLDTLAPSMLLWRRFPADKRQGVLTKLKSRLGSNDLVTEVLPLSGLPAGVFQSATAALKRLGPVYAPAWAPDFPARLAAGVLSVSLRKPDEPGGGNPVMLEIGGPYEEAQIGRSGTMATFTWRAGR